MSKKTEPGMIVGLDIGTSKIVAIVGEVNEDNELEIIGIGTHPSIGLRKGVVINIESTVESIKKAVEDLYNVEVSKVNTMIMPSKSKNRNTKSSIIRGRVSGFKKAVISLAEGETINFFGDI